MKHSRPRRRRREDHVRRRTPPGSSPGTIVVDPSAAPSKLHLIAYGPQELVCRDLREVGECREHLGASPVTWLDVDGLGDQEAVLAVGELFRLHQLALEDVVNVHQRPKAEDYGDFLFFVARMPAPGPHLVTEQLSLFLGRDFVVTFQDDCPGDCFGEVRRRLRETGFRLRRRGSDYLAYALIDALVDAYFPLLEVYGARLEELEEQVLAHPERQTMAALQEVKRDLLTLRRIFWPLREAVGALVKDPSGLIQEDTRLFLRDCYDHTTQLMDLLESYREITSGLVELYMTSVSHRMNEVMKLLTLISTVFIPLSFIAGLYGMNFEPDHSPYNMPELRWFYGYPFALTLMAAVALGLLAWLKRKGWLAEDPMFASPPAESRPEAFSRRLQAPDGPASAP